MAFRLDKLTLKAQEALQRAQEIAQDKQNPQLEPLHLLAGLLAEGEGIVGAVLEKIGANRNRLAGIVEADLKQLPRVSGASGPPQPSPTLMQVLEGAAREAETFKDEFVSTEHLLLALVKVKSKAQDVLQLNAVGEKEIVQALKSVRGSARVTDQSPEDKFQALEKYGIDLVQRARQGKLDPVIGRDAEIRRVIQVLSRRTKNNPVLIGEPGVGKNGHRRRARAADCRGRRAQQSAEQASDRAGYGRAGGRCQVPRRV